MPEPEAPLPATHAWIVPAAGAGVRLDAFLAERLAQPRNRVHQLLARGAVRIDGRVAAVRAKGRSLGAGARVVVEAASLAAQDVLAPDPEQALTLLASGAGWVAVDKPAGVPVHPLRADERGCVINALAARLPQLQGVGEGGLRSGVVHRLDVSTSGVLVVATEAARWAQLRAAFRAHRVDKRYRALVLGEPAERGAWSPYLRVAVHRPARVRVAAEDHPEARPTRLGFRVIQRLAGASLVEVRLETGFLHQIRATFAHHGHPLVGDERYGYPGDALPIAPRRPLLHAASLRVDDVAAESPDPPDLSAALQALALP